MGKVFEKTCKECGKEFTSMMVKKTYCCDKCRDTHQARVKEERKKQSKKKAIDRLPTRIYHKTCKVCGCEFDTGNREKRTCSYSCAGKLNSCRTRDDRLLADQKRKKLKPLAEDDREAREKGKTYGQLQQERWSAAHPWGTY